MLKIIQLVIVAIGSFLLVFAGCSQRESGPRGKEDMNLVAVNSTLDARFVPVFRNGPPVEVRSGAEKITNLACLSDQEKSDILATVGRLEGMTAEIIGVEYAWPEYPCAIKMRVPEGFLILQKETNRWTAKALLRVVR